MIICAVYLFIKMPKYKKAGIQYIVELLNSQTIPESKNIRLCQCSQNTNLHELKQILSRRLSKNQTLFRELGILGVLDKKKKIAIKIKVH